MIIMILTIRLCSRIDIMILKILCDIDYCDTLISRYMLHWYIAQPQLKLRISTVRQVHFSYGNGKQ